MMVICILCRGSYFSGYGANNNVIVIENNPQYTMPLNTMGNYQQPYMQNNNYPQQQGYFNPQYPPNPQYAQQQQMRPNPNQVNGAQII